MFFMVVLEGHPWARQLEKGGSVFPGDKIRAQAVPDQHDHMPGLARGKEVCGGKNRDEGCE
jgi:hypothetical protein